jgi:UDPglucose 6-dehydrogenase
VVGVLGLSYKPGTPVVEESAAVDLALAVVAAGARVVAYDPLAGPSARAEFGDRVQVTESLGECLHAADVVLIATPDPAFLRVSDEDLPKDRELVVVDYWRLLAERLAGRPGIRYIAGGRSMDDPLNAARLVRLWAAATGLEPEPVTGVLAV